MIDLKSTFTLLYLLSLTERRRNHVNAIEEGGTIYTSLFAQKEQQGRKQTIKKQQQTTLTKHLSTTLIMISYHMTCYLRVITKESVLKKIFQVIDIVDLVFASVSGETIL